MNTARTPIDPDATVVGALRDISDTIATTTPIAEASTAAQALERAPTLAESLAYVRRSLDTIGDARLRAHLANLTIPQRGG